MQLIDATQWYRPLRKNLGDKNCELSEADGNIRRWIIENDWLEAIVALPLRMFYNTGIAT